MSDLGTTLSILERLIAFDTTSRNSNLDCIEWIEARLGEAGASARREWNEDRTKANLFATIGPDVAGGVILSGHSDVVPVDGQTWSSDPWLMSQRDGKVYGRGTCDMKGFLALVLAYAPLFARGAKPVHFAVSYDEEVGCKGAPAMIERLAVEIAPPRAAIIGEPTLMRIIDGHKGITVHEVRVRGHEAHSSLTHMGVSANMVAIELMAELIRIARDLEANSPLGNGFEPAHATLTVGTMQGGNAPNILAGQAVFAFDLRCPPGDEPDAILAPFFELAAARDAEIRARFPECGVEIVKQSSAPPLVPDGNAAAVDLVRKLTGENAAPQKVSFAAEAGQFRAAGFPTVVCGPGSIEQAHQPDEWIALEQLEHGQRFMERLAGELAA